jgi:hypothetical protein
MGLAKAHMMKLEELGLCSGNGGCVCGDCIGDPVLAELISRIASEVECKYCGRNSETPFSAPLGEVVEFMAEVINEEWTDPANELPYETREGGYQGNLLDAFELLEEIEFEPECEELFEDVASYFMGREWCRKNYFEATPAERQRFAWDRFCSEVKHVRRYTFWNSMEDGNPEYHPDYLPPGIMLSEIESVIADLRLIREVSAGTKYRRVQDHDISERLRVPTRFTSLPQECATQPNRMSPAGIPMFYGAEDFDTAAFEVVGQEIDPKRAATGVAFEARRPLNILDLTSWGGYVSYFAPNGRLWKHRTEFLRYFTGDVSKPIVRDKQQHIEYVPTQVFTEYVRFHIASSDGKPVDGIRYSSSGNQRPCVVLFFDQDDCLNSRDGRPQALAFVPGSERTIGLDKRRS